MTAFDDDGFTLIQPPGGAGYAVLNDSPVGEGGNEDLLEITVTAGNLAELILDSRAAAPFTVAVDAGWGMGKSSLLRGLDTALSKDPAVSTVWFNAWTAERAGAVEGLIKSVLLSFDRNVVRRALRGTLRRTHVVGGLRAAALVVSSVFGLGRVVDAVWRALSVDAKARNEIKTVVRDMAAAWLDRGGDGTGKRLLVVFVDDLDRCSDQRIFEVCEAIKLYLDVPGIVFVLACDQAVLWRAVGRDDPADGVRYLEKIIQVSYPIPQPSDALARKLVDGYVHRSGTAHLFDDAMKRLLVERTGRNPRRIKRLINSFVVEHHLGRGTEDLTAETLVKVILLRHFYPEFHTMVTLEGPELITRFLDYANFRAHVRHGTEPDPAAWERLFAATGVVPAADLKGALEEVTQELAVSFPELAKDEEFVELVRSLPRDGRWLRRPMLASTRPYGAPSAGSLLGMRVLWIDDNAHGNIETIDLLRVAGARVETVADGGEALTALPRLNPTVIVSDVRHGENPQAGFDDLRALREHYDGPAFFYCGQVTPSRLERARELGARGITTSPRELVTWLTQL